MTGSETAGGDPGTLPRRIGLDVKFDEWSESLMGAEFIDCVRLAEESGFDSVWTNEDIGYDSIALLTAASTHTRSIALGTAVVNAYCRSALQVAMGIATLDELSGGRAVLGLGVGHHPWNDKAHGIPIDKPVARLREYVEFIRKALTGEPFTHEGRVFHGVNSQLAFRPPRANIPILVAGTGRGPRIVALAGEVADGLMVNVVTADYVARAVAPRFWGACRDAHRDPATLELMAVVTCCVAEDPDHAFLQARGMLLYRLRHLSLRVAQGLDSLERFQGIWAPEHHEEIGRLVALVGKGRHDEASSLASRKVVTSLIPNGTSEDVLGHLESFFAAGCTRLAIAVYPRGRAALEQAARLLAPKLPGH